MGGRQTPNPNTEAATSEYSIVNNERRMMTAGTRSPAELINLSYSELKSVEYVGEASKSNTVRFDSY